MSLVGPWLSTTSTKKRKETVSKARQAELERDWRARNQRLKEIGLPKETYEQFLEWVYGRGKKAKAKTQSRQETSKTISGDSKKITKNIAEVHGAQDSENKSSENKVAARPWITGPVSSKPSPTYTGSEMIGLTIIHKSCIQPVFNKEAAIDAANMRR